MDWLAFSGLVFSGFVACSEFGSFLLVGSVLTHLADVERIELQQRLSARRETILVFPSALIPILLVGDALRFTEDSWSNRTVWGAIFCFSVALAVTFWWHNPITRGMANWNPRVPPEDWKMILRNWRAAQGARALLQFAGFALFCVSVTTRLRAY
jgi:hypothetical protein